MHTFWSSRGALDWNGYNEIIKNFWQTTRPYEHEERIEDTTKARFTNLMTQKDLTIRKHKVTLSSRPGKEITFHYFPTES